jgi:hypothetical protein
MRLSVSEGGHGLAIRVGPLPSGAARRIVELGSLPALGNLFDRLSDRWEIVTGEGRETLLIEIGSSERETG